MRKMSFDEIQEANEALNIYIERQNEAIENAKAQN